jgi:putative ABC transport system permease protein
MLTVVLYCWIQGVTEDMISSSASFDTGHVKIMSRAYAAESDQLPNDLALIGVSDLLNALKTEYTRMVWTPRIRFGGLLDIPDEQGETRAQGPVIGLGVDLFSSHSPEYSLLNLHQALVRGKLPEKPGEIVISEAFARRLNIQLRETATLISSTMYGSMAACNFTVAGTIRFGVGALDRGSMIADIEDVQFALNMEDAAGEILGFSEDFFYYPKRAADISGDFNAKYQNPDDEFSPVMKTLRDQGGLGEMLDLMDTFSGIVITIFVVVMSIVLWNAGLIGSMRRYGEIGVRLAIGEYKGRLYRAMIAESLMIGLFGSIVGTAVGLGIAYFMQEVGFDISSFTKNASMMISNVMRARITPAGFFIGFIPGLVATFLGTAISGISIYQRQTSQLMKERLIVVLLFLTTSSLTAQTLTGTEILKKVDENQIAQNRKITYEMVIHGRRGSRTLKAQSWIEGAERSFTEYLEPAREKGTKMLKLEDQLWTYSPSTDRTIKISGHMLRQSVMGSDLSYEDMMEDRHLLNLYEAEVVGEETYMERPCWILKLTAKVEDVAYHSRDVWIDQERYLALKESRYAKSGKLLKTTAVKSVMLVDDRWVGERVVFKDELKSGEGTEFIIKTAEFDIDIPEYIFSKAALRK